MATTKGITISRLLKWRDSIIQCRKNAIELMTKAEKNNEDAIVRMYQWHKIVAGFHLDLINRLIKDCTNNITVIKEHGDEKLTQTYKTVEVNK